MTQQAFRLGLVHVLLAVVAACGSSLGDSPTGNPPVTPIARKWIGLATGSDHACGIRDDGATFCWKRNGEGRLGNTSNGQSPARVGGTTSFVEIIERVSGKPCGQFLHERSFALGYDQLSGL